jgi:hypothetical protein
MGSLLAQPVLTTGLGKPDDTLIVYQPNEYAFKLLMLTNLKNV